MDSDVLWEVSHSPMMAQYLTFHYNRALHIVSTNPDENYAREIMQLFTIVTRREDHSRSLLFSAARL